MTLLRLSFYTVSLLSVVVSMVIYLPAQDYCISSCPGNLGCQSREAEETNWCMYPDTGCNGPTWTNIGGCCYASGPLLIDLTGDGFMLTAAKSGVLFDFFGTGRSIQISWTAREAANAWLVLDRNNNGRIDNGFELFGNVTQQPARPVLNRNGFAAPAEFDKRENGGNGNNFVDAGDSIFSKLRLWVDANHNGVSEDSELQSLTDAGIGSISLDYKESRFVDQYGNRFRYRAKVFDLKGAHIGKFAYDVFLLRAQ